METTELLKKVRQIEIKTRGLSNNIFAGQYHSAFKGRGMAFSEVREYQFGDDIRDIDWNVTARFNKPYVKVFEEERELTVMLLVDVSGSLEFGTVKQMKKDMVTEIAATLAFSAIQNNDKIGVIFFSAAGPYPSLISFNSSSDVFFSNPLPEKLFRSARLKLASVKIGRASCRERV